MENGSFFNRKMVFNGGSSKVECFRHFDTGSKGFLDAQDLHQLVASAVYKSSPGESFPTDLMKVFDRNQDSKIDSNEFDSLWRDFLRPLLQPVTALLVIDVQNDFIDGSLALRKCKAGQEGKDVIPVINKLLNAIHFDVVVYSIDCHPEDHVSFYENRTERRLCGENVIIDDIKPFDTVTFEGPPTMKQKLWPKHCVKGSWGAKLHPDLKIKNDSVFVYKGTNSTVDSYSAFWDNMKLSNTILHEELQRRNVTHVFVCGLAFDYCVSYTVLDAVELGYATAVVEDAVRSTDVDLKEEMQQKLVSSSCLMVSSKDIEKLVEGTDVRVEFATVLGKLV